MSSGHLTIGVLACPPRPAGALAQALLLGLALAGIGSAGAAAPISPAGSPSAAAPSGQAPATSLPADARLLLAEIHGQLAGGKEARAVCLVALTAGDAVPNPGGPPKFCYFNFGGPAWSRSDDEGFAREVRDCAWNGKNLQAWAENNGLGSKLTLSESQRLERALAADPTLARLTSLLPAQLGYSEAGQGPLVLASFSTSAPAFKAEVGQQLDESVRAATLPSTLAIVASGLPPRAQQAVEGFKALLDALKQERTRLESLQSATASRAARSAPSSLLPTLVVSTLLVVALISQVLLLRRLAPHLARPATPPSPSPEEPGEDRSTPSPALPDGPGENLPAPSLPLPGVSGESIPTPPPALPGSPGAEPPASSTDPPPGSAAEDGAMPGHPPAGVDGMDQALRQETLREELAACGWPVEDGPAGPALEAAQLLEELRVRISSLALSVAGRTSTPSPAPSRPLTDSLAAIEQSVAAAHAALAPREPGLATPRQSLDAAAERAAAQASDLARLREEVSRLASRCATGGESPPAAMTDTSGHLETIRRCLDEIAQLEGSLIVGGVGGSLASAVAGALSLLAHLRQWLCEPRISFSRATERLDRLAARLAEIGQTAGAPEAPLAAAAASPEQVLTRVQESFRQALQLATERQRALQELTLLQRQMADLKEVFGGYRVGSETFDAAAARLIDESKRFHEMIERLGAAIASVAPDHDGELFPQQVERLVGDYRALTITLTASRDLTQTLLRYLQFTPLGEDVSDGSAARLAAVVRGELETPHAQLRLGLLAALGAFDREIAAAAEAGRRDVISALHLPRTLKELADLRSALECVSPADLWERYLQRGFSQDWLHHLLRAEALLATYFQDQVPLAGLRDAVSLASATLRRALACFNARIVAVELLAPAPDLPAREMEVIYEAPDDLRHIPEVRARVARHLPGNGLVVDLRSYLWHEGQVPRGRARVIALNPVEWRD